MKVTISFELDKVTDSDDLVSRLNAALAGGEPVKKIKKEHKPMPEGPEKDALLKRLAKRRAKSAAKVSGVDFNEAEWEANYAPTGSPNDAGEADDKVAKAEALGKELAKGSKSVAAKKPTSKLKPAAKKKAKEKAKTS